MKYTAQEKESILKEWRTSGLGKLLFCKQRNIAYQTMHGWVKRQNKKEKTVSAQFIKIKEPALNHPTHIHSELQFPSGVKIVFHNEPQASFVKQFI
jgi:hypothetical protein